MPLGSFHKPHVLDGTVAFWCCCADWSCHVCVCFYFCAANGVQVVVMSLLQSLMVLQPLLWQLLHLSKSLLPIISRPDVQQQVVLIYYLSLLLLYLMVLMFMLLLWWSSCQNYLRATDIFAIMGKELITWVHKFNVTGCDVSFDSSFESFLRMGCLVVATFCSPLRCYGYQWNCRWCCWWRRCWRFLSNKKLIGGLMETNCLWKSGGRLLKTKTW